MALTEPGTVYKYEHFYKGHIGNKHRYPLLEIIILIHEVKCSCFGGNNLLSALLIQFDIFKHGGRNGINNTCAYIIIVLSNNLHPIVQFDIFKQREEK